MGANKSILTLSIAIGLVGTIAARAPAVAQTPDPAPETTPPAQTEKLQKPFTITGCVVADGPDQTDYTLSDTKAGIKYRLSGLKVLAYEGRRVRIVGGLYPSANIAAQAGSIDPTKAAMAAQSGRGLATVGQPLEYRVTAIRPVKGSCPPAP